MGSVWKRLQRVNKRAAKFQFTISYHQVALETTPRWWDVLMFSSFSTPWFCIGFFLFLNSIFSPHRQPTKLSVVLSRRSRRVVADPLPWEPTMKDPMLGYVVWPIPDNKEIAITLFKNQRTNEFEDKEWTFILEDVGIPWGLCCFPLLFLWWPSNLISLRCQAMAKGGR